MNDLKWGGGNVEKIKLEQLKQYELDMLRVFVIVCEQRNVKLMLNPIV